MSPPRGVRLAAWVAVAAITAALSHPAQAQSRRIAFDLPAQPLSQALVTFSLAAGEQVIAEPNLLRGRVSRPVRAGLPADDALRQLLAGSGLRAERTPGGVLMIRQARPAPAAPVSPAAPPDAPPLVDELLVTAQKRVQPSLETPLSLTTLSGADLQRLGIDEMEDVGRLTPGLSVVAASPAIAGFSMRGVTQASGDATREPRMSVFQDGVPASKERGAYFELFDLQRIEVAKGPQSTLFGRGAMTGAVNVIQNKADPSAMGSLAILAVGDLNLRSFEGMVNLPLGETAAVRLAGVSRRRDGYVANLLGGEPLQSVATDAARLSLAWRPRAGLSGDLIVNYQRDQPNGMAFKSFIYAPTDPATGAVTGDLRRFSAAALSAPDADGRPRRLGLNRELLSVSGLAEYVLGPELKLSGLASYRRFAADQLQDADGTALPIIRLLEETRGVQFNHELRLDYDPGGRWRGFIGVNAFSERGTQRVPIVVDERLELARITGLLTAPAPPSLERLTDPAVLAAQLQALASARGYALPRSTALALAANLKPGFVERNQNFSDTHSYDIYADATYRPAPRWEITAGARFSLDHKSSGIASATPQGPTILGSAVAAFAMAEPARSAFLAALAAPGAGRGVDPAWPSYGLIFQPTVGDGDKISRDLRDGGWSWRLVTRYAATPTLSLYGSYARGRRPTVLIAGDPSTPYGPARFAAVPAETVDSLEVGLKTVSPSRRLRLDAAVYAYAYKDFQTTQMIGGQLRTVNAGGADAHGLELQGEWAAAPGATLSASYAYGRARLGTGALKGNRFRLAPDHKFSVRLDLTRDAFGGRITFTPLYSWQSEIFFSDDNDIPGLSRALAADSVQDERQGAYGLLDLRLSYHREGAAWTVTTFVKNALDQKYIQEAGFIGESYGYSASAMGAPRTMGIALTLRQ